METGTPNQAGEAAADGDARYFTLRSDTRGALINGALFGFYAVASLALAVRAEPNSAWFYVFYFLFFIVLFQGITIVFRHCLHLTPGSVIEIAVLDGTIRLARRNGERLELVRNVGHTGRGGILVVQGETSDGARVSEVIREGALGAENFAALAAALERLGKRS